MKFARAVLLFAILSLGLSGLIYFINPGTIVQSWTDKLAEVGTVALVIFIFLLLLYTILKIALKSAMGVRKKGLPKQKGPKL